MSREYIVIGASPCEEDCAQVGAKDYGIRSAGECRAYIHQIRRVLGQEPGSALLGIKHFEHDFGTYREVVCYYQSDDEPAMDYAWKCESDAPASWDEEARKELASLGIEIPVRD